MPAALTYPGVYVQEIPSGVRTITGVATSITAFVGAALRGPDDEPVTINNFGDFDRVFGGLWVGSTLGYAVRDYFLNGGGQAVVVRVAEAAAARAKIKVGTLKLEAASKGTWGAALRVTVDKDVRAEVAKRYDLAPADLFNLTVREVDANEATLRQETFLNLTTKESPRRVDRVLRSESRLLRWEGDFPNAPIAVAQAEDEVTSALNALAALAPGAADDARAAAEAKVKAARAAQAGTDGKALTVQAFTPAGAQASKAGLYALEQADLFNLLCIPPYTANGDVDPALIAEAAAYCARRRALLIVDPPSAWTNKDTAKAEFLGAGVGADSSNAAVFFPRLRQRDPLRDNQLDDFAPCGAVAGVIARTDAERGVWKAPAGMQATLNGVPDLSVRLTDDENGELNPLGINCLRSFAVGGRVIWGARTLRGADQLADEYKYIPVRRTALYIEESLRRGLQWVVFEPNDEPLWAQIRLNAGAFMQGLFRKGAFQGASAREAYFVKCDRETTTQADINLGVVNVMVGFAPLKPAEFVVISIQQMAGQIAT